MYDGGNRNMRVFSNLRAGHVSDGPFFSALPEKKGGEKGRLDAFGACCGCSLDKHLFFSRYEHTTSPYGGYGTRRLLWHNGFVRSYDLISAVKTHCIQNLQSSTDLLRLPNASSCRALHGKGRWHFRRKCRREWVASFRVLRNLRRSNPLRPYGPAPLEPKGSP